MAQAVLSCTKCGHRITAVGTVIAFLEKGEIYDLPDKQCPNSGRHPEGSMWLVNDIHDSHTLTERVFAEDV